MWNSTFRHGPRIAGRVAASAFALALAGWIETGPRLEESPRLNFYPSLQVRFVGGQASNYFMSHAGVVNVSGAPMTDLVLRQKFPGGFAPRLITPESQAVYKRPEGFREALEEGVYTMHLPELRVAEATALAVELRYTGRPAAVTFQGVEVEYTLNGQRHTEKGPDLTWDLSRYTKYSGTLREFIKRYAGVDLRIPEEDDWGFSNLANRASGKPNATGPIEIESDSTGRLRFSIQAGEPGALRQLMMVRRRYDSARHELKAGDEVRRLVMDQVQATADFTLDADNAVIEQQRIGRYDAWVLETRWRDRVKERLGEGPSRWYVFADKKAGLQYIINLSAQGRGAGPGRADAPNPEREQELMAELEGIVTTLRIL